MSGTRGVIAVTGGTGFLGSHTVAALAAQGWTIRLLARREPSAGVAWSGFVPEVVLGSLSDSNALQRLVEGVDAVVHLAGLIKARNEAEFMAVNRDGTQRLVDATKRHAPSAHFVQISSLAARSPELSGYAASKRAGEDLALNSFSGDRVSVIRPPAIYGPGDRETLVFFQLGSQRMIPLPSRPRARFALIHVEDAAALIANCVVSAPTGRVVTLSDDHPAGYSWREILDAAAQAVGNHGARYFPIPASLLKGVGGTLGLITKLGGPTGMVNAGKIRELLHEDWAVRESERMRPTTATIRYNLAEGFASTARWYRQCGWL